MTSRSVWARRVIMPLIILAVAGVLAVWGSHRQEQQQREIRQFIVALLDDTRQGRELTPRLAASNQALAASLAVHLRTVVDRAGDTTPTIEVTRGDTDAAGPVPEPGTHTALVSVGGEAVLGLRIAYDRDIVILGYWLP